MNDIITLTMNPSIDKSFPIATVQANIKLRADSLKQDPGGGGLNVSRAIKKLGGDSTALFLNGGCTGEKISSYLKEEGLDFRSIKIKDPVRESLAVLEENTGNQFRFTLPSPEVSSRELEEIESELKKLMERGKWLVASGSLPDGVPEDFYATMAETAASIGCRTLLDSSGGALQAAIESGKLFLVKCNLRELAILTGHKNKKLDDSSIRSSASELIDSGKVEHLVVSMGSAGGAYLANKEGVIKYKQPQVKADSRIGAGDSMVAGIVYRYSTGASMDEAVRFGIASGTAAVMTPGTDLCRAPDAERIFHQVEKET